MVVIFPDFLSALIKYAMMQDDMMHGFAQIIEIIDDFLAFLVENRPQDVVVHK